MEAFVAEATICRHVYYQFSYLLNKASHWQKLYITIFTLIVFANIHNELYVHIFLDTCTELVET